MYSALHRAGRFAARQLTVRLAALSDYDAFYQQARVMMYNSTVKSAFSFSTVDSTRYGSRASATPAWWGSTFWRRIKVRVLSRFPSEAGTCPAISTAKTTPGSNLLTMGKQLDDGYSSLLTDLKSAGLLDSTLVVMASEFGRTVGPPSAAAAATTGRSNPPFLPARG